jgi:hypothetical protein
MAKLNRIILAALRKSNKPENLKGIVARGYAYDYAKYLIGFGDELPSVVTDWIIEKGQPRTTLELVKKMDEKGMEVPEGFIKNICKDTTLAIKYVSDAIDSDTPIPEIVMDSITERANNQLQDFGFAEKILEIVLKMEMRGLEVPETFMQIVYNSPVTTAEYALQKYDYDPETTLDQELFNSIIKNENAITKFIREFLAKDLDVSLLSLEQWNAMAEKISPHIGVSDTVYVLVRRLIENGLIKSYKQISRKLIQIILRDSKTVNKFAHFILPYVKELPEEIKSKVTDQKVLKPDWRKVNKFDESFSSFFKKK